MSKALNFGLVGAGAIAQTYVQAFATMSGARLAGIADVRVDAAKALAEGVGCSSFDSHESLAEGTDLHAVIVSSPPAYHAEISEHFINLGIPVFCEKPLTPDVPSARRMVELASEKGVLLTMASKFRYVEDVIRAKSIVTSGILGEIILFENAFTARVDMSKRWNTNKEISGGGVLIDNGTHSVDLLRYFLGPISDVHVVEGKRAPGLPVEDTVQVFLRSRSGIMGHVDLSWRINKELDSYIDIYGTHGTIRIGWRESRYRQSTSQDWIVFGNGYQKVPAFANQLQNFCNAIRGSESLRTTPEDAIASVEVVEFAYESLKRDHWVSVESNGDGA